MRKLTSIEFTKIIIGLVIGFAFCFSSCNSSRSILKTKYLFESSYSQRCFSADDLIKLRETYYEKDTFQQILIFPLLISDRDECVGLWVSNTKFSPDRPILILGKKVYFFSKVNSQRNDSVISIFKDLYAQEFDPIIIEQIERHFLFGTIKYFLH